MRQPSFCLNTCPREKRTHKRRIFILCTHVSVCGTKKKGRKVQNLCEVLSLTTSFSLTPRHFYTARDIDDFSVSSSRAIYVAIMYKMVKSAQYEK